MNDRIVLNINSLSQLNKKIMYLNPKTWKFLPKSIGAYKKTKKPNFQPVKACIHNDKLQSKRARWLTLTSTRQNL